MGTTILRLRLPIACIVAAIVSGVHSAIGINQAEVVIVPPPKSWMGFELDDDALVDLCLVCRRTFVPVLSRDVSIFAVGHCRLLEHRHTVLQHARLLVRLAPPHVL